MRTLDLVVHTLNELRTTRPREYASVCSQLARLSFALSIDGERIDMRGSLSGLGQVRRACSPSIEVTTTSETLLALIEGRVALLDCLLDERLILKGDPDRVVLFHDAFVVWIRGVVQCERAELWLEWLRRTVDKRSLHIQSA